MHNLDKKERKKNVFYLFIFFFKKKTAFQSISEKPVVWPRLWDRARTSLWSRLNIKTKAAKAASFRQGSCHDLRRRGADWKLHFQIKVFISLASSFLRLSAEMRISTPDNCSSNCFLFFLFERQNGFEGCDFVPWRCRIVCQFMARLTSLQKPGATSVEEMSKTSPYFRVIPVQSTDILEPSQKYPMTFSRRRGRQGERERERRPTSPASLLYTAMCQQTTRPRDWRLSKMATAICQRESEGGVRREREAREHLAHK